MLFREKGFTLIEIMVVVLIFGFLLAIAIPFYATLSSSVKKNACYANLQVLDNTLARYNIDKGSYPPLADGSPLTDFEPYFVPEYLKRLPSCPQGGDYTYHLLGTNAYFSCSIHGNLPKK